MKVQFVSGPRAGQTTHLPRDRFSDLLIQAGVLELVEDDQPRVPTPDRSVPMLAVPKWGIFTSPRTGDVAIQCDYMRGTYYFNGDPELAHTFKVGPHKVPLEVAMEYMSRKAQPAALSEATLERDINAREELYSRGGGTRPKG